MIVHGVGDFNQEKITTEVCELAKRHGVAESDVSAFNWDREVGGPFKGFAMDLGILAELGDGLLNVANLGFFQNTVSYCGIPHWFLHLHNWIFSLGQIALSLSFLFCLLEGLHRWPCQFLLYLVAVLFAMSLFAMLLSPSTQAVMALTRRLVVTILWPLFHFTAVLVGFGLIAIAIIIVSASVLQLNDTTNGWLMLLTYMIIRLASIGAIVVVTWIVLKWVRPVLKVLSDVARYAGIPTYRAKLKQLLTQKLHETASGCDHLIILAHSLGSVIAVDCMLECSSIFSGLKQVDVVTMGSPLRRLFHPFFPGVYAPVETISRALRENISGFAWVNVYRPLDIIGARLGSTNEDIIDLSTSQLLKNHPNYWGDPKVATLISNGITVAKRSPPIVHGGGLCNNWPPQLCTESYPRMISRIWGQRLKIFKAAWFGVVTWVVVKFIARFIHGYGAMWSMTTVRQGIHDDGWMSTIVSLVLLTGMLVGGLIMLLRFLYKIVWRMWLGAYGASLLGFVEEARRSPLQRYSR